MYSDKCNRAFVFKWKACLFLALPLSSSNTTITSYIMQTRGNEYERKASLFLRICSITVLSYHLAKYHVLQEPIRCESARPLKRLIVSKALETASSSVNPLSSPFFSVFRPLVTLLRFGRTKGRLSGHRRVVIIKVSLTRIRSA